jgi:hypothetical protein
MSERAAQSGVVLDGDSVADTAAAGDLVVVGVPADAQESPSAPDNYVGAALEIVVLDATTGREVDSFGIVPPGSARCAADEALIACLVGPGLWAGADEGLRLATLRVDGRRAGVSEASLPERTDRIEAVVDGRIVIRDSAGGTTTAVDRFANTIDVRLPPGDLVELSDRYAIFRAEPRRRDQAQPYAVYRAGS